jgi:hypothetical protein
MIRDNKQATCTLIDAVIPREKNERKKERREPRKF